MTLEDQRHAILSALDSPASRKALVMEWHAYGLTTDEQTSFWIYVWGLRNA